MLKVEIDKNTLVHKRKWRHLSVYTRWCITLGLKNCCLEQLPYNYVDHKNSRLISFLLGTYLYVKQLNTLVLLGILVKTAYPYFAIDHKNWNKIFFFLQTLLTFSHKSKPWEVTTEFDLFDVPLSRLEHRSNIVYSTRFGAGPFYKNRKNWLEHFIYIKTNWFTFSLIIPNAGRLMFLFLLVLKEILFWEEMILEKLHAVNLHRNSAIQPMSHETRMHSSRMR